MELENVKTSRKGAMERKRTCNISNKVDDNVKEISVEIEENDDADENNQFDSFTYDIRRHKTGNTGERRLSRRKESYRNGIDEKIIPEISPKKYKIQVEQEKLYNKLKLAAESESSFYESDCETENKLCGKSVTLKGRAEHDDKSSSSKRTKNTSENLVSDANEVISDHYNDKYSIDSIKDVNKCLNEKGKVDWREHLLMLEMSHNDFDDNTNTAENHASDQKDKSKRKTKSTRQKDLNVDKTRGKVKKIMNISKKVKESKDAQIMKIDKSFKGETVSVFGDEGLDRQALSDQVNGIRKMKKTKMISKEHMTPRFEDSAIDNRACVRLRSSDSGIHFSSSNQNDDCYNNFSEDFGLSLKSLDPCSFSTPLKQSKMKKRYSKKRACKRKINMVPRKRENKNNLLVIKDKHDPTSEASSLDLSLPTPRPPRDDYNPFSVSYDEEKMDTDSSSDEDLPAGITPLKIEKTLSENDIVWVKWKKWPQLPALVRKVYKKKRRVTCAVFYPNGFEKDFTLSYNSHGSIIPYCDTKKDEILASTKDMSVDDQTFFRQCCAAAENFLTKEALKGLGSTGGLKEIKTQEADNKEEENCDEKTGPCKKKRKMSDCSITKIESHGLSKQGQLRVEKMARKTKPLTDFLVSDTTKEYLEKIYNESIPSDLHTKFLSGTIRERAKMKHRGFGPIDDDEQIELLLNTYVMWIKQINRRNIHEINYVFDVWVPEAVVFAFKTLKRYSWKRAWEKFNKGVRRTKEELQILHNDMIDVDKTNKLVSNKRTDFVLK